MLKTFTFGGKRFQLLPTPVEVTVKPESEKLTNSRMINVIGYRKSEGLVLFAKPGDTVPVNRLYQGHIEEPPEEWTNA